MFIVRIVLDILALLLVIASLAIFGLEGLLYISDVSLITPLGELWFNHLPNSLNLTQAIVQRYLSPALWDIIFVPVLLMPAWKGLAISGGVCLVASAVLRQIAAWLHS